MNLPSSFSIKSPFRVSFLYKSFALILATAFLVSCGGGGGGSSSDDSNGDSPGPSYNENADKSAVGLALGAPTASPVAIPPASNATEITFQSVISGTEVPEYLVLDEVDASGTVITANVAQLKDDGEQADATRGDRIYTGTLMLGELSAAEKRYQVRAESSQNQSSQGVFWVSQCPVEARPSNTDLVVTDDNGNTLFANEVMLNMTSGTLPDLGYINAIAEQVNGRVVGCVPALNRYLLEIEGDGTAAGVATAISTLEAVTEVESAYANFQLNADFLEGSSASPRFANRPEDCTNDEDCLSWHLNRIRALEAWEIAGAGNREQGVAIIDFGVDCSHPELDCEISQSREDSYDHGTAVASLIAGNHDATDVSGVAWNSQVYPYSFVNQDSQYKMAELISRSVSNSQVKVINISAATPVDSNGQILQAICQAIDSGRLVVASSGNASQRNDCQLDDIFPAKYNSIGQCPNSNLQDGLLVVGATDKTNRLAEWEGNKCSNLRFADIFAPGEGLYTASVEDNGSMSYRTRSGTSYAAPLVAASAAVLWSARPSLTPKEVHDQLLNGATLLTPGGGEDRISTPDERLESKLILDLYRTLGGSENPGSNDLIADDFNFSGQNQAPLGTLVTSDSVTISGLSTSAPIRVQGGFYSIDNEPFTNVDGKIRNNQFLRVQGLSSDSPSTSTNVQLAIGDSSPVTFQITTGTGEVSLAGVNFPDKNDVALNQVVRSIPIFIQDVGTNTPIRISNGEYAIDGSDDSDFSTLEGVISNNQRLQLRLVSANEANTTTSAIVTIGDQEFSFSVTTEKSDIDPVPFTFQTYTDVGANEIIEVSPDNAEQITGINTAATVSVVNGEYRIDSGPYTREASTINNGQRLTVRHPTASRSNSTSYTTVSVGEYRTFIKSTTTESAPDLQDLSTQPVVQGVPVNGWRFANNGGERLTNCQSSPALPSDLNLSVTSDGRSCEITGIPTSPQSATDYAITATNVIGSSTANTSIRITDELLPPVINVAEDQVYLTGTPVALVLENTGGGNLSSCVAVPSIAGGLSLSTSANQSSCLISGTPNSEQAQTRYSITATNSGGTSTSNVNITINQPPVLGLVTPQIYIEDTSITPLVLSNNGGTAISSCQASPALPAGLSVSTTSDNSSCRLSGTPLNPQVASTYQITASNSFGSSHTNLSITISYQIPNIESLGSQSLTLGSQVALLFSNSGGGNLDTCDVSPALPAGLSIAPSSDQSTCQIIGTPTELQGSANYTVSASNVSGTSANAAISIAVSPQAPSLNGLNQTVVVDEQIDWTFDNNGGAYIESCGMASGSASLPSGLSLAVTSDGSSCQITGAVSEVQDAQSYTISAVNASGSSTADLTLAVFPRRGFVTTWKTDNPGFSEDNQIKIGTQAFNELYQYNYSVDWGDDTRSENVTGDITHTYALPGEYQITITGIFPAFGFYDETNYDNEKLISVDQWGDIQWTTMYRAFFNAANFNINATDVPDLSQVEDMTHMFSGATNFDTDINHWDVSNIRWMQSTFAHASSFNQDLDRWDVSSVEAMREIFSDATAFNGNISTWNLRRLEDAGFMFNDASNFNPNCFDASTNDFGCPERDINNWNVSSVTITSGMFRNALLFNGDISQWRLERVRDIGAMFAGATNFNQNLNNWWSDYPSQLTAMTYTFARSSFNSDISGWDTSNVTTMTGLFSENASFNRDISQWDTSSVTNMSAMFYGASSFNQNIGDWVVDSVTDMSYMFNGATNFNQPIGNWAVDSVTDMSHMFNRAINFNQAIGSWNVANVTTMNNMFNNASLFNQDISSWSVSNVDDMNHMFFSASVFNQDIADWDTSSVTNMSSMFSNTPFNQDINSWDVSLVTNMSYMFAGASQFNQAIGNWVTSSATSMSGMFSNAVNFNQDISSWDTSNVTSMNSMFQGVPSFNQNLGAWVVDSVTDMSYMFAGVQDFNSDISSWNVANVTAMNQMFESASAFNQYIGDWDVSNVTNMEGMFHNANSFNQNISSWNVSSVNNMDSMFVNVSNFDQDLGNWDVSSVTNMNNFLLNVTLSTNNYDSLLTGWSALSLQSGVDFHGGSSNFSSSGAQGRDLLINTYNWNITDDGPN